MEEIGSPGIPEEKALTGSEKKSGFGRWLWRFFKWTFFTVLFLVALLVALVFIYEDDVKKLALDELNKRLNAEVKVNSENIGLTVFSTFPNAAVELKDVVVFEALQKKQRDTIIDAGKISLQFNVMDLWKGNYDIHKILIADTRLDFLTDKNGRNNFDFLKESTDTTSSVEGKSLKFKLDQIVLENVEFKYRNKKEHCKIKCKTESTTLSGAFSEENYTMSAEGKFFFQDLILYNRSLLSAKNVNFKAEAEVKGKDWSLMNTSLAVNQLNLSATGKVEKKDSLIVCDLKLDGKEVDVRSALSLLPESQAEKLKDYESDGNFYFSARLNGQLTHFDKLAAEIDFGVRDAVIRHLPSSSKLNNVNLTGKYRKPLQGKDELVLNEISVAMNSNFVKGDCKLTDLNDPFMELNASVNAELAELIRFYPVDTISFLSGKLDATAHVSGLLKDLKSNYAEGKVSTSGQATISNLFLLFKHSSDSLRMRSGNVEIQQNDLRLKDVSVNPGDNEILLNGELNNFFAWLLKENEVLTINGNAKSRDIKIDRFLSMFGGSASGEVNESTEKANTGKEKISISDKFNLSFEIDVAHASWEKFQADDVHGKLRVKDGKIFADDLAFRAFDGEVNFTGIADTDGDKFIFKGSSELVQVNISKLFSQFNNFHQEAIQDKHIKGVATVSMAFHTAWSQDFTCDLSSISVNSDVLIERGELNDYKPLEALAKYIEVSELKRIKFSTLRSHVDIKNQTVFLAKTEVNSSAMNLNISGSHSFNNDIDYHMSILMSELMAKKPGKNKQLDEELRYVENDPENRRTVFLRMSGNIDDIKISYDRKAAKEKLKEDIKSEKQNLKMILNEEFGLFKKDTTLNKIPPGKKKKSDQNFKVDFGDGEKKGNTNTGGKKKEEDDDEDF